MNIIQRFLQKRFDEIQDIFFGDDLDGTVLRGITWKQLESANKARIPTFLNSKGEMAHSKSDGSDWSPAQWLQAITGELGEYANLRKKYERGDISQEEFNAEAAKELADVIIYLSILAFQLKIDLDEAVIKKFNEVSERVNSPIYLDADGNWYNRSRD